MTNLILVLNMRCMNKIDKRGEAGGGAPIHETWILKLVFMTIPCPKFWALYNRSLGNYRFINTNDNYLDH